MGCKGQMSHRFPKMAVLSKANTQKQNREIEELRRSTVLRADIPVVILD